MYSCAGLRIATAWSLETTTVARRGCIHSATGTDQIFAEVMTLFAGLSRFRACRRSPTLANDGGVDLWRWFQG
jgi:hypothetical protein